MKSDDVALIQRILNGDQNAFASLVRKYQQQVHTFAWRKTGDFQIAEDIVQETFLQVYQKLDTLEDPTQFTRWLHQIANRRCIAWLRKNRVQTEPLEETDIFRNRDRGVLPIRRHRARENGCWTHNAISLKSCLPS